MSENQVAPGTIADVMLVFNLYGYYDGTLKSAIEHAPQDAPELTQWLPARSYFPDAFYDFNQTGKMVWDVSREMLMVKGEPGALCNLAVLLRPAASRSVQMGRLLCTHTVEFTINTDGELMVLTEVPEVAFSTSQLTLTATAQASSETLIRWDFGDQSGWQEGAPGTPIGHVYSRPGSYTVTLRLIRSGRLRDFKATVTVSKENVVMAPLTAAISLTTGTGAEDGLIRVLADATTSEEVPVTYAWSLDKGPVVRSSSAQFDIPLVSGQRYSLQFTAIRTLAARLYSYQRYFPDTPVTIEGLTLASSNQCGDTGSASTEPGYYGGGDAFTDLLFGGDPISPVDRWTLDLASSDTENLFLRSVDRYDTPSVDLSELEEVTLVLEYETV